MALQRENPLPVGRYWIDVFDDGARFELADRWFRDNAGAVKVDETETFEANAGGPARVFRIFRVVNPMTVRWPATELGFPTVAGADVKGSGDTVQRPPPEKSPLDELDPTAAAKTLVKAGAFAVVLLAGAYAAKVLRS